MYTYYVYIISIINILSPNYVDIKSDSFVFVIKSIKKIRKLNLIT